MKIKNKKTGEIVEIKDPKELAKYGIKLPKAQDRENIQYNEEGYPVSMRPIVGDYDYSQPLFNWQESQFQNPQEQKKQNGKSPFKRRYTNIQGNQSSASYLNNSFQNLSTSIAQKDTIGIIDSAVSAGYGLSKYIPEQIGARKVNNRLQSQVVNNFQDVQRMDFLNDYNDSQYGTTNIGMAKHGKLIKKTQNTPLHTHNVEFESEEGVMIPNGDGTFSSDYVPGNIKHGDYNQNSATGEGLTANLKEGTYIFPEALKTNEAYLPNKKGELELKKLSSKKSISKIMKPYYDSSVMEDPYNSIEHQNSKKIHNLLSQPILLANQEKTEFDKINGKYGKKVQNNAKKDYEMKYGGLTKAQDGKKVKKTRAQKIEEKWNRDFKLKDYTKKGYKPITQNIATNGVNKSDDMFYGQQLVQSQIVNPQNIQQVAQPTQILNTSDGFNYNFQEDKRKLDPLYPKMNQQKTPTGVVYEPPVVDVAGWKNIENQLNLAHPDGIPFSDNTQGYYRDKDGNPITDKQQLTNLGYQEQYYDDMLETPEGRAELAKMWQSKGKTLKGLKLPVDTSNLTSLNDKELYDKLNSLRPAYLDSYPKVRKEKYINPNPITPKLKTKEKPIGSTPTKLNPLGEMKASGKKGLSNAIPVMQPFNEPYLESPIARFKFNPNLVDFRKQSPDFTEIDRQFQLSRTGDPRIDANLFAKTLNAKNQLTSNVFNANQQGQFNVDQTNAQILNSTQAQQYGENAQFRDLVGRMRGAIGTQKLLDRNVLQANAQKQMDYYNFTLPTIENLYGVDETSSVYKPLTTPLDFYYAKEASKKSKKMYGGKIKPKIKKKSSK